MILKIDTRKEKRRENKRIRYLDSMIRWVEEYIEKENPILRLTIADYRRWLSVLKTELYGLKHDIKKSK